jgi:RHS repeat-associated protein
VVAEPTSFTLPDMEPGDTFRGEFTLTNLGLVRADDLDLRLPAPRGYRYETGRWLPESLEARERITVPFRVTRTGAESGRDGGGDGSGCIHVGYAYICSNGDSGNGSASLCLLRNPPALSGGGIGGGSTATSSGTTGPTGPAGNAKSSGGICLPIPTSLEVDEEFWDILKERVQNAGCSVDTWLGQFNDSYVDLAIVSYEEDIDVRRVYRGNRWQWPLLERRLEFVVDELGHVTHILRAGSPYEADGLYINAWSQVYRQKNLRIVPSDSGFVWWSGTTWERYDGDGRLLSWGRRAATTASLVYTPSGDRVTALLDRDGSQRVGFEYDAGGRLRRMVDDAGRDVTYTYTDDLLETIVNVVGDTFTCQYDGKGRLIKEIDWAGREATIDYYDNGRVKSVMHEPNRGLHYDYGYDKGRDLYICRMYSDFTGNEREQVYDREGRLRSVDINGERVATYAWDGKTLLESDERGLTTRTTLDEWDKPVRIQYPGGEVVTMEYGGQWHLLKRVVDARGVATRFEHDARGNPTTITMAAGTDEEIVVTCTYDANDLITSQTTEEDGVERTITYQRGDNGHIRRVTDPEGCYVTYEDFHPSGKPRVATDSTGERIDYTYDDGGRTVEVARATGQTVYYDYDPVNRLTRIETPGNVWSEIDYGATGPTELRTSTGLRRTTRYDARGLPVAVRDNLGGETTVTYDQECRITSMTDPGGNTVEYVYEDRPGDLRPSRAPSAIVTPERRLEAYFNASGRVTRCLNVIDGEVDSKREMEFDRAGNLTALTDEDGHRIERSYDAHGRTVRTVDAAGHAAAVSYNAVDRPLSMTTEAGERLAVEFDRKGRVTHFQRPGGQQGEFEYASGGQLSGLRLPNGKRSEFELNASGLLSEIRTYETPGARSADRTTTFTYDPQSGDLTGWNDGVNSAAIEYNTRGQLTSETVTYGDISASFEYDYDGDGNLRSFTSVDGVTYNLAFDEIGRVTGVEIPGEGILAVSGHDNHRIAGYIYPGGAARTLEYNAYRRLRSVTVTDPSGSTILERTLERSPTGIVMSESTENGTWEYEYDPVNELTGARAPDGESWTYTYDGAGNRLTGPGEPDGAILDEYCRLLEYGDTTFAYDGCGNCIEKTRPAGTLRFSYDAAGTLVRVTDGADVEIARYGYDPFGRRIWKESAGVRTYFVYCEQGLLAELSADGTPTVCYGLLPISARGSQPFFVRRGGVHYWVHCDATMRPSVLTDSSGAVAWRASYTPFGAARIETAVFDFNLRLPGQYFDSETGLHHNWMRTYDPDLGRYLQPDPLGAEGNAYAYANGNPFVWFDPSGANAIKEAVEAEYQANLDFCGGNALCAANETFNPLWWSVRDVQEAVTGVGHRHYNQGRELSALERGMATVSALLTFTGAGKLLKAGAGPGTKVLASGHRQLVKKLLPAEMANLSDDMVRLESHALADKLNILKKISQNENVTIHVTGSMAETIPGYTNRLNPFKYPKFIADGYTFRIKKPFISGMGKTDLEIVIDSTDPSTIKYIQQLVQYETGMEVDTFYQMFYKNSNGLKNYGNGSGVGVFSIHPDGSTQSFFSAWSNY